MEMIRNYIGGEFVEPSSGEYLDNFDPSRGKVYSKVPQSDGEDIKKAIAAAQEAFPSWARLKKGDRAELLQRLSQKILDNIESLATDESLDTGKPLSLTTKLDIPRSARNFSFFAEEILHFHGHRFEQEKSSDDGNINEMFYSPLGVVACISPWNLPLYLLTWKIAPALAAGNTVVAKPSEITPLTAYRLSQIMQDLGFPRGVVNIVHGRGENVGKELVGNSKIKAVSFTGSTRVGREIAVSAAGSFKKVSLEMGGKNPTVVFADCDFDSAVKGAVRSAFLNQGQICLCGSRLLIEISIYDKFKRAFLKEVSKLKVGDPRQKDVDQGAIVSGAHFEKIMGAIEKAKNEGGQILTGGKNVVVPGEFSRGWYIAPTVIEGLGADCQTNQEEIFGPVVTIQSFNSDDEALKLANSTRYGLAASLWTTDAERIKWFSQALEVGVVWVNTWMARDLRTPFGGVKESGVGREGGKFALQFFSEIKNVCIKDHQGEQA